MTVKQAIEVGVKELGKAHTHDPEGCARFLLRYALGEDPIKMSLADPDKTLSRGQKQKFRDMLDRRLRHEPVWYITNEAYFWRDAFYVDGRVLIPRPETELLVETVLADVRQRMENSKSRIDDSRVSSHGSRLSVIDVGTGAGVIAISLAKELTGPRANQLTSKVVAASARPLVSSASRQLVIYATDISPGAIEVAKKNAERLGVEGNIRFLVGDALEPLPEPVDIIVGNPPYVPSETVGGLAYDIHHFEPRIALDGGKDGLDVHRKILAQARKKLRKHGAIFLEIGHDQGRLAAKAARQHFPRANVGILKDYDGNDRILSVKTKGGAYD